MCKKWKYKGGYYAWQSVMIFYVRVTPLEATHSLFLLPAIGNTYTMDTEVQSFYCQLTDLREIWHAYHAIQRSYTPTLTLSNFISSGLLH